MMVPRWYDQAACRFTDFDFFTNDYWEIKACVMTCAGCPVRVECLTFALDETLEHGIWGGVKGHTLVLLRSLRRRGRHVKQLEPGWTKDFKPFGEWEELTGWDYPTDVGRPRGDEYTFRKKPVDGGCVEGQSCG